MYNEKIFLFIQKNIKNDEHIKKIATKMPSVLLRSINYVLWIHILKN